MKTDKQLIREGKYLEALGENYNSKPIYVMIFQGTKRIMTLYDIKTRVGKQIYVADDDERGEWFGKCIAHLKGKNGKDITFYSIKDAKEWIAKNRKPLSSNQWYSFGNHNADWL